jgi:hypothetical protein
MSDPPGSPFVAFRTCSGSPPQRHHATLRSHVAVVAEAGRGGQQPSTHGGSGLGRVVGERTGAVRRRCPVFARCSASQSRVPRVTTPAPFEMLSSRVHGPTVSARPRPGRAVGGTASGSAPGTGPASPHQQHRDLYAVQCGAQLVGSEMTHAAGGHEGQLPECSSAPPHQRWDSPVLSRSVFGSRPALGGPAYAGAIVVHCSASAPVTCGACRRGVVVGSRPGRTPPPSRRPGPWRPPGPTPIHRPRVRRARHAPERPAPPNRSL